MHLSRPKNIWELSEARQFEVHLLFLRAHFLRFLKILVINVVSVSKQFVLIYFSFYNPGPRTNAMSLSDKKMKF